MVQAHYNMSLICTLRSFLLTSAIGISPTMVFFRAGERPQTCNSTSRVYESRFHSARSTTLLGSRSTATPRRTVDDGRTTW